VSAIGHKGISFVKGKRWTGYKITCQWKGKLLTKYLAGKHPRDLKKAIRVRNSLERLLGRPRTEMVIRSSGVAQGRRWKRRKRK
jgi:hypothetical protein